MPGQPTVTCVQRLSGAAVPLIAALGAFAVGALMIWMLGASPWEGFKALFSGAFGGRSELADTAVKATPLLLVGTGICIAFRARVINVGGEGQILLGALFSTITALGLGDLPGPILLPLVLLGGMVGGGVWGAIPGALKAYLGVNEILSTIMLNIVAVQLVTFLLRGPLIDPATGRRWAHPPDQAAVAQRRPADPRRRDPHASRRGARRGDGGRGVGLPVAIDGRLPHPRRRRRPGCGALCRDQRPRDDDAGTHREWGAVWAGRGHLGVRQ